MRCEKCKYITKTTCQCHFGYEQASKEFLDGNCEKFIDKYKEEYTPIIAKEIFAEIEKYPVVMQSCILINKKQYDEIRKKYIGE